MLCSHLAPVCIEDIMIYDEESDRHVHIPFDQALFATTYGADGGGVVGDLFKWSRAAEKPHSGGPSDTDWGRYDRSCEARLRKMIGDEVAPFKDNPANMTKYTENGALKTRAVAVLDDEGNATAETRNVPYLPTAADLQALGEAAHTVTTATEKREAALACASAALFLCRNGIWCPVEIVVCRPFIEHLMLSAIVTVAGRDTGATLFGPAGVSLHSLASHCPSMLLAI